MISRIALQVFSQHGFENTTMSHLAQRAGIPENELFLNFGNKEDIVLFFYQSINADWQERVSALKQKKLSDRFEAALQIKLDLMSPYNDLLAKMIGLLLLEPQLSVNSATTSHIRALGMQTMNLVIEGATDGKKLLGKINSLPSLLYLLHWGILFISLRSSKDKAMESARLSSQLISKASNWSFLISLFPLISELGKHAQDLGDVKLQLDSTLDRQIWRIIANHRKTSEISADCSGNNCETCYIRHGEKISFFTRQQKPIHFILPAFPAKSPNKNKVLGELPDLGEEIALTTLENLCKEIQSIYAPGATVTICSDGRIFSELVGVTDAQVSSYVSSIRDLIAKHNLQHIQIVNLEDLVTTGSFEEARQSVLDQFAESLEELHLRLKQNEEFRQLFGGIHKFINEDRRVLFPELSASKCKEESKPIALKVIQHSNAWTRFLLYVYPEAFRLSIHPYPSHSEKTGIRLTRAANNWITPWHGVMVLKEDGYLLMKKDEAEKTGARLIYRDEQPYYYSLIPES